MPRHAGRTDTIPLPQLSSDLTKEAQGSTPYDMGLRKHRFCRMKRMV